MDESCLFAVYYRRSATVTLNFCGVGPITQDIWHIGTSIDMQEAPTSDESCSEHSRGRWGLVRFVLTERHVEPPP